MTQYIAFLRAINVGGHIVKMDHLRRLFGELGFTGISTFIASGNVIFETDSGERERELVQRIESHLHQSLGYEVATFLRTPQELAAAAILEPFAENAPSDEDTLFVSFLAEPPADEEQARLLALRSEVDDFHVAGREAYWLRRAGGQTKFTGAALEKALRRPATMRNMTTVRKLSALYPPRR
jgi:uncharacterized protein (DUF1697 family)